MVSGILYGRPQQYLTADIASSPLKLADWIEREVPCMAGNLPIEYSRAINDLLSKRYVPMQVRKQAFTILAYRKVMFDHDLPELMFLDGNVPRFDPNASRHQSYRPVTAAQHKQVQAYTFEEYERKYVLAIKTQNVNEAEAILAAVLELIWGVAKGYGKTRQGKQHEKVVEWDEFNRAVDEALSRATNLQTNMRYITREELRLMRDAPTPRVFQSVTLRFVSRISPRNGAAARRNRK